MAYVIECLIQWFYNGSFGLKVGSFTTELNFICYVTKAHDQYSIIGIILILLWFYILWYAMLKPHFVFMKFTRTFTHFFHGYILFIINILYVLNYKYLTHHDYIAKAKSLELVVLLLLIKQYIIFLLFHSLFAKIQ